MQHSKRTVYGIVQDGIFIREVKRSRHFYWKYSGYAFGESYIQGKEFDRIEVREQDTGTVWTVTRTDFEKYAKPIPSQYGTQLVLSIKYFTAEKNRT